MTPAFKEWFLVCDALGSGRQSLLLRKGGIAEGRAGFSFKESRFCLFPTLFHEQVQRLRIDPTTRVAASPEGKIEVRLHAEVVLSTRVQDWNVVERLEPFHIWKPEIIRERYDYEGNQEIHLAVVRISKLTPEWVLDDCPRYGGCRSWVDLPELPGDRHLTPVIDDPAFECLVADIRATGVCA